MSINKVSQKIRTKMSEGFILPDERELTRYFLNQLSTNHRIKSFALNQNDEGKYGADWVWFIVTDYGIYQFVVQAKKLYANKKKIVKAQALRPGASGKLQIEMLINLGKQISATPLYILFSDQINKVSCGDIQPDTNEGVFFDLAQNIYNEYFCNTKPGIKHMPITCLFACFSQKCYYKIEKAFPSCVACKTCRKKTCITTLGKSQVCNTPFEKTIKHLMHSTCQKSKISEKMLLLMFADSVMHKNKRFLPFCFDENFNTYQHLINNIIITDYTNRHNGNYIQALLGEDFKLNSQTVLQYDYIYSVLYENCKKYPIFEKVGIFGSYAKDTATSESDVDIALVYDYKRIKTTKDLELIIDFIKSVSLKLAKNIDFVDYESSKKSNTSFYEDVSSYIKWIDIR